MSRVAAALSADDVKRAYYALDDVKDNYNLWIRALMLDPNELIISDDSDGSLYRVPFTVNGDDVEFGDKTEVKVEYVDVAAVIKAAVIKASAKTHLVYASRAESRPTEPGKESSVSWIDKLRAKLGLGGEVSEEDVLKAAAEALPDETDDDGAAGTGDSSADEESEDTDGGEDADTDTATVSDKKAEVEAGADKDRVVLDRETFEVLKAGAADGRKARAEQVTAQRLADADEVVVAAREGKIPGSRIKHYQKLMAQDREGTKKFLAELESGAIPVEELGVSTSEDGDSLEASAPLPWFGEIDKRPKGESPVIQKVGD
jgi:hypothetical protein